MSGIAACVNDGTAEKFLQMKQEELEEAIANGDA